MDIQMQSMRRYKSASAYFIKAKEQFGEGRVFITALDPGAVHHALKEANKNEQAKFKAWLKDIEMLSGRKLDAAFLKTVALYNARDPIREAWMPTFLQTLVEKLMLVKNNLSTLRNRLEIINKEIDI
uniref:Uncharacterized protein n=1 Tax=Chromera velia CCMP2878 TaxID=1169474 RepID=A0A0G4F8G5_9ALVE|eukprot:Cvel_15557.t1-p1 / transcript=Cvel_15557.t1 / gene=Cvel_15557 / organism=Chromera_velia_CCMP2878 / gene_product=hypothetical protein / transcript_product=hypothetical protein / location=Cvel_scaffold1156:35679-36056(+) / protein_length=126 / sequence_SO=supercontig / SO=protein_coding / is_pseudo=false